MSMMDMMGGGMMGGGGAPAPAAPEPPENEESVGGQIQDILNDIQELLRASTDPEEQAALSTAESALSKLVLNLQKQKDAAMGTTPAHKYVERAARSAPPSGGGGY